MLERDDSTRLRCEMQILTPQDVRSAFVKSSALTRLRKQRMSTEPTENEILGRPMMPVSLDGRAAIL